MWASALPSPAKVSIWTPDSFGSSFFFLANIFIYSNPQQCSSLAIDGFDELVKIGPSTVTQALMMASSTSAKKIILSSRSSEWSESYTQQCRNIFSEEPLLVYLKQFNEQEQKILLLVFQNLIHQVLNHLWNSIMKHYYI